MLKDFFNKQLNIKEAHELPDKLMEKLMDPVERIKLFDAFQDAGLRTNVDTMNDFFQSEHSDRNSFMQDFTPESITSVIKEIIGRQESIADLCAGVGGLSNQLDYDNIYMEELSKRAIPLLLFVQSIRNKKATIWNGDSLTGECNAIYRLTPTDKYSDIDLADVTPTQFDAVVSNPPYSLKYDDKRAARDNRFVAYPLAPKSKADYAFLIHGLSKLKPGGTMAYVLPHGVLFRGNAEADIRKHLIDNNLIHAIIGMPGNMFFNTTIPTVLVVIKKDREEKDVLFIDATKTCEKQDKFNILTDEHISKVASVYHHRLTVEKFSQVVTYEMMQENDFNLNIPRYVDTFEPEPVPDLIETMKELIEIDKEIKRSENEIIRLFMEIEGTNEKEKKWYDEAKLLMQELMK